MVEIRFAALRHLIWRHHRSICLDWTVESPSFRHTKTGGLMVDRLGSNMASGETILTAPVPGGFSLNLRTPWRSSRTNISSGEDVYVFGQIELDLDSLDTPGEVLTCSSGAPVTITDSTGNPFSVNSVLEALPLLLEKNRGLWEPSARKALEDLRPVPPQNPE